MLDTKIFITEIHRRDALWNTKNEDYTNRSMRKKLWLEVAAALHKDWEVQSCTVNNGRVKNLQMKWRYVRKCFTRELRLQKCSCEFRAQRKRYVYFEQLRFLLDQYKERNTSGIIASKKRTHPSFESLPPFESLPKASEKDSDMLSLLSFLPMFRKLNNQTKKWAQEKILEIMQQAMDFQPAMSPIQQFDSFLPNNQPSQGIFKFEEQPFWPTQTSTDSESGVFSALGLKYEI